MSAGRSHLRFIAAASIALTSSACAVLLDFEEAHDMSPAAITTDNASTNGEAGADSTPSTGDATTSSANDASSSFVTQEKAVVTPEECSTCVATPPAGWQGPLAIYEGSGSAAPGSSPACGGQYPLNTYDGFSEPAGPPAQCTCSCDAPSNIACSAPVATYFGNSTCSFGCSGASSQPIGSTCTTLTDGYCSGVRFSVGPSTASGGSCAPVLAKAVPAPTFATSVRLCASPIPATRSTCTSPTDICAPRPSAPFNTQKVCVARAGDWTCPAGYPNNARYHVSVTDTRSCSTCSCGSPSGATCSGSVSMFKDDTQCSLPKATLALPVVCASVGSNDRATATVTPSGGSCTPSGGTPTGEVTPGVAMTVCCAS